VKEVKALFYARLGNRAVACLLELSWVLLGCVFSAAAGRGPPTRNFRENGNRNNE